MVTIRPWSRLDQVWGEVGRIANLTQVASFRTRLKAAGYSIRNSACQSGVYPCRTPRRAIKVGRNTGFGCQTGLELCLNFHWNTLTLKGRTEQPPLRQGDQNFRVAMAIAPSVPSMPSLQCRPGYPRPGVIKLIKLAGCLDGRLDDEQQFPRKSVRIDQGEK
jgi:hypothetical protein